MTTTIDNTILLIANSETGGRPPFEDKINAAAAAITPGALLKISGANGVVLMDTGNPWQRLVALESPYSDANNIAAINDTYAQNETVRYCRVVPGDEFLGLLTNGQSVVAGAMLVASATDGEIVAAGTHDATLIAETVIGFAAEGKTASGAAARIKVIAA